jgi:predicted dehydrogenase
MIARQYIQCLDDDPRCAVRWVADVRRAARTQAAELFRVPHATADYRRMLDDRDLHAVIVATPPHLHVKMGIDTMRAGKHLLIEKPLGITVAQARRLVDEAKKHRALKVSGCSARHARLNPKFTAIKKMIDRGDLGEIYFVHHRAVARRSRPGIEFNPSAKWFLDRDKAGGGPLYDWGVYDLAFHLGLLDQPRLTRAIAFCRNRLDRTPAGTRTFTVEEHGGAMMEFDSGLRYYWERASNAHGQSPHQTSIYGTRGGLQFAYCTWNTPQITRFDVADRGRGRPRTRSIEIDMSRHPGDLQALVKAYVDHLLDKAPTPMPLEIELENLKIMHRVYRAAGWT